MAQQADLEHHTAEFGKVIAAGNGIAAGYHAAAAAGSPPHHHSPTYIVFRSLVSPKEAGAIIGKGGANVAAVREETGVRAGVSKSEDNYSDRILTISGDAERVAQAYGRFSRFLCEGLHETPTPTTRLRILTPHALMGAIIGKGGAKIKSIQTDSGSRMSISKDILPQSTERTIDIIGTPESIEMALLLLANIALDEVDRTRGTIFYNPNVAAANKFGPVAGYPQRDAVIVDENAEELTQTLTIPANMVGCIIGRGGSFIAQIRRLSGARLRIDDAEAGSDERKVHIVGTETAINAALGLLYTQLETEKARRQAHAAASASAMGAAPDITM